MSKVDKIVDTISDTISRRLDVILGWSKKYSLPGLGGVPIYNMVKFVYIEMTKDNISTRSMAVAYSFFLAIFPFIIFLFTLLPYLPVTADYLAIISTYITDVMPENAAGYLLDIIKGLAVRERGLQSAGIVFSLLFASSGMLTLMYGFDKSHNHEEFKQRGYFKMRWIALLLTLVMSLLFVSSFILLIMGNLLMDYAQDYFVFNDVMRSVISLVKYMIASFLLCTGMATIYRYGPSLRDRLPFFNTGVFVATGLAMLVSVGFSYYVNNFGKYNEIYGSIGALIVIMLWFQFISLAILIGFEINASIAVNKGRLFSEKEIDQ